MAGRSEFGVSVRASLVMLSEYEVFSYSGGLVLYKVEKFFKNVKSGASFVTNFIKSSENLIVDHC